MDGGRDGDARAGGASFGGVMEAKGGAKALVRARAGQREMQRSWVVLGSERGGDGEAAMAESLMTRHRVSPGRGPGGRVERPCATAAF